MSACRVDVDANDRRPEQNTNRDETGKCGRHKRNRDVPPRQDDGTTLVMSPVDAGFDTSRNMSEVIQGRRDCARRRPTQRYDRKLDELVEQRDE